MHPVQPRQRRSRSSTVIIVTIVLATFAGGGILAVSYWAATGRDIQMPVTENDLSVLLRAVDFEEQWGGRAVRSDHEKIKKVKSAAGAVHLTYRYGHDGESSFELSSELHVMANRNDARQLFEQHRTQQLNELPAGSTTLEIDTFQWGDSSTTGRFVQGEGILGFYFVGRHRDRVFHVEISGSLAQDEEAFMETLIPHVEKLDEYSP